MSSPWREAATWPDPADPEAARRGLVRWQEAVAANPAAATFAADLAASENGTRMLAAVFGGSPFLTGCVIREPAFLQALVASTPETAFERLLAETQEALGRSEDTALLMQGLRRARRRAALLVALADIGRLWSVAPVTAALSRFAELALGLTADHLLRRAAAQGDIALADPARPSVGSGLVILGMGKLGAGELNYSSDIDLIVLYDEARIRTSKPDRLGRSFVRLTRELVRVMEQPTAEGYVFRTDLRLRPDPGVTPLAVAVAGAESYYTSLAQTWERAAFIKARVVAGDHEAGAEFLGFLKPFIWRRNLDFTAVQDIHAIKRRIHDNRGHRRIALNGHDVKLGRGGIRDIEFFVQTEQLVFGGRDPALRAPQTVATLAALARAGRIGEATAARLTEAYEFLRQVEHRLQMVEDRQTHRLPEDDAGLDAFGRFLGFATGVEFRQRLQATLQSVEAEYARLFEKVPAAASPSLSFAGADEDPATVEALRRLGFADPSAVIAAVRGWLHGRYRATRSERARTILTELLPTLLAALGRTAQPDAAFLRFDAFLARLPAGAQLFALFQANPDMIGLVAEMLGTSTRLADHLARHPAELDAVITPGFFERLPERAVLVAELDRLLGAAGGYEDELDTIRRWTNDHRFRAGVHVLRRAGALDYGPFLSDVADLGLDALLPRATRELARRHGRFDRPRLAVVAMGKLGGREMTIRSDLDLILVYDGSAPDQPSAGPHPLLPAQYFARLSQRLIGAITAPTSAGALYEVDMRLRPSGNQGPVAVSLVGFRRYQEESAWAWEHMALTRARVVAGPPELARAIEQTIAAVLTRPRDPAELAREVDLMRRRIARQHLGSHPWDIKYRPGGLIDIEFTAQYLQLRHAAEEPSVLAPATRVALSRLVGAGRLTPEAGADLIAAAEAWQRVQAYLRLTVDGQFEPEAAPEVLKRGVARALDPTLDGSDFGAVERRLEALAAAAHARYRALVAAAATTAVAVARG